MWYWTNFLMQMMARAGLAVAVTVWLISQMAPANCEVTLGAVNIRSETNETKTGLFWVPKELAPVFDAEKITVLSFDDGTSEPDLHVFGISMWDVERESGYVLVEHWSACLTFLVATLVTSRRWKPRDDQTEEPVTEAVAETE